jgi:regulation of enolase protein 1 (concanavalin A-like superfamily)
MTFDEYKLKEYLGDSVYIGLDPIGRLWIFTYNGFRVTNEIFLGDDVVTNFIAAMRKFGHKGE